jgi:hypothetical protein
MIVILRNRQRVRKRQRRRNEQYRCNETVRRIFHRHGEPIKHFPYELFHSACAKAEGRLIFLPAPARAVVEEQWRQRQALWPSCAFVFHHDGARIRDLRGAWNKACAEAGLTGKIPNDLRRTCVRNLTRAGITESVAMRLTATRPVMFFGDTISSARETCGRRLSGSVMLSGRVRLRVWLRMTVERLVNRRKSR